MTTCKIILTPTTKEPNICHALATTSAFNLKLCHMLKGQCLICFNTIYFISPVIFFNLPYIFWNVDRRPSTAEAAPRGEIHPFSKMAVNFEPLIKF